MSHMHQQELLRRIVSATGGQEDAWRNARSALRQLLCGLPNQSIRDELLSLVDKLEPPFSHFSDDDRRRLTEAYDKETPGVGKLFTANVDLVIAFGRHLSALTEEIKTARQHLTEIFENFISALSDESVSAAERAALLAPKVSVFIPERGWFYIDEVRARKLASLSAYSFTDGIPTPVSSEDRGTHEIATSHGVHFKSGRSQPPIQPGKQAIAEISLETFAAQIDTGASSSTSTEPSKYLVAAPSALIVIEGIPYQYIVKPEGASNPAKNAYSALQAKFLEDTSADICAENPELAAQLQQETQHARLLIQASYSIEGVNLLDVFMLQYLFKHACERLSGDAKVIQSFLAELLNHCHDAPILPPRDDGASSSSTSESTSHRRSFFDVGKRTVAETVSVNAYIYIMATASMPPVVTMKESLNALYKELFPDMGDASFHQIYHKLGETYLISMLGFFKCYQSLTVDIDFSEAILFLKLFSEVLPKFFPTNTVDAAYEQIPDLWNTLDSGSASALIGLIFILASDARFANFIFVPATAESKAYIVGVDLDDSTDAPYTLTTQRDRLQEICVKLRNEFLFYKPWMEMTLDSHLQHRLIHQSPLVWLTDWLIAWGKQDKIYQSMFDMGVLKADDVTPNDNGDRTLLPLQLQSEVIIYMYKLLCQLSPYLRCNEKMNAKVTHRDIVEYLLPIMSKLYFIIEGKWIEVNKRPMDIMAIQVATQGHKCYKIQCNSTTSSLKPAFDSEAHVSKQKEDDAWTKLLDKKSCFRDFDSMEADGEMQKLYAFLAGKSLNPLKKVVCDFISYIKVDAFCQSLENLHLLNALLTAFPDITLPPVSDAAREYIASAARQGESVIHIERALLPTVRIEEDKVPVGQMLDPNKATSSQREGGRPRTSSLSLFGLGKTNRDEITHHRAAGALAGTRRTTRLVATPALIIPEDPASSGVPLVGSLPASSNVPILKGKGRWSSLYSEPSITNLSTSAAPKRKFFSSPSRPFS